MEKIFEKFNKGTLKLAGREKSFDDIEWSKHSVFEGVELKHILTSQDSNGQFSFHLVRIAPGKSIKTHVHEKQVETHEVILGSGICINNGVKLSYTPGSISMFEMGVPHEVKAGTDGLYLFAKFFPALC